jgi:hypothetical protein
MELYYNNAVVMVVKIDFSNLPVHLRNAITNEIGMKKRSGKGRSDGDTDEAGIEKSMGNKNKDEEVDLKKMMLIIPSNDFLKCPKAYDNSTKCK